MTVKKKIRKILWGAVIIVISALILAPYRLPYGRLRSFRNEIVYQVIDIGQADFMRWSFEGCFFKRRVFVVGDGNEPRWFYVSEADFERLLPEPWPKMREENYTIEATFNVRPLLLTGGYTVATVTDVKKVNKRPIVSK
jgi:hypothetical protein